MRCVVPVGLALVLGFGLALLGYGRHRVRPLATLARNC